MMPLTLEWVSKAENDFNSANRLARARKSPDFDVACFHAQQCAEKYMKARLQEATIAFPKTHDLTILLTAILPLDPTLAVLRLRLDLLSKAAVEIRYPGRSANRADAGDAIATCREVGMRIRASLGLTV